MACGSCGLQLSFGRKRANRRGSRRGSRRGRKSRRHSRRSRRGRSSRRRRSLHRRRNRRFGILAGPGFKGQTSYSNPYAPYFGSQEPFVAASEWWAPVTGGVAQYPQMLMK